ncbi:hypothetical protein C8R43DRAFT_943294 [Mycena crocata]|nr:hypothetical protein C8R43DRAFT_943294 [Mycena crocata]
MSRGYYSGNGSSSKNYPISSYSSLANAGMSYPTTNQSNPSGHHGGGTQPGPVQSSSSNPHRPPSTRPQSTRPPSQPYPQGYGSQNYGMTGPPMSPDSPLNYNTFNTPGGAQYPNTAYNAGGGAQYPNTTTHNMQWPGAQAPEVPWNDVPAAAAPYGTASNVNNYPYPSGLPSYPSSQYPATSMSNHGTDPNAFGVKQCYHCRATSTPLWRRDPTTHHTLCNACGLYLQQRHALRPQELIDADNDDEDVGSDASEGAPDGPECSHCHTRQTSVWRRNKEGDQVCNACGVYMRLRGKPRPLELRRNKIKPRAKHPQT